MKNAGHILVIKLGALGDFISSCGLFRRIRAHHAGARITLMTTGPFAGLARQSPYFDDVWTVGRPGVFDFKAWLDIRSRLRHAGGFDAVYDLQRNDRTRLMRFLSPSGTRKMWLGGSKRGTGDPGEAVPPGMLDTRVMIKGDKIDISWLCGKGPDDYGIEKPYVLIVPGSSPRHPGKRWPVQHFSGLLARLSGDGYKPVVIGTRDEAEMAELICGKQASAVNLAGKTGIEDIAALARSASAVIGNDTGPIHIAAAAGCPFVVLFSHLSRPEQSLPPGEAVRVLRAGDMSEISVDAVFSAFDAIKRS